MDYNAATDPEINVMVAKIKYKDCIELELYNDESLSSGIEVVSQGILIDTFNPCNNPSDAWTIIEEIWGMLMSLTFYDYNVGLGAVQTTIWEARTHMYGGDKLRVAMIVYLIMKERI